MASPLRIEFAGVLYHVTAHGNARESIDRDRCKLRPEQSLKDIPKKQKQAPIKPLSYFARRYKTRDESLAQAYRSGHYTLA